MASDINELYERMCDLAKRHAVMIVTAQAPRSHVLSRRAPWQDPPEIIFIDYLDNIKPNRSEL